MSDEQKRKRRAPGDEGQPFTVEVMRAVKHQRLAQDPPWSAERLAEEMAGAGVPWTRDTVVNLENGRRKRLAVHEVVALAYVLGMAEPLDLIVPRDARMPWFPVVPSKLIDRETARAWISGGTGPLREYLAGHPALDDFVSGMADTIERLRAEGVTGSDLRQAIRTELEGLWRVDEDGPAGENDGAS